MSVDELRNPLCTDCVLHETAQNICVIGTGNANADIFIIGEGPGADEDKVGRPFVGRAGKLLRSTLRDAGLDDADVFITNLVKCRPPANRRPTEIEAASCIQYLIREYNLVGPGFVWLLGNSALHLLTRVESGISKARGWVPSQAHQFSFSEVYTTFHPSAALRSIDTRAAFERDLHDFVKIACGDPLSSLGASG